MPAPVADFKKEPVTFQFLNELKQGKKGRYASVKTDDKRTFMVDEEMWNILQEGVQYEIDYQLPDPKSDFPPWIKNVRTVGGADLVPPSRPVSPTGSPLKAYSKLAAPNGDKDTDIATQAIFKSMVEGGAAKPSTAKGVAAVLDMAWEGWLIHKKHRETFKMKASDEMNDEIPNWGKDEH
jgi:hypothetical protein